LPPAGWNVTLSHQKYVGNRIKLNFSKPILPPETASKLLSALAEESTEKET
jgi:hypothetical protein